jgi:hypothetical protein
MVQVGCVHSSGAAIAYSISQQSTHSWRLQIKVGNKLIEGVCICLNYEIDSMPASLISHGPQLITIPGSSDYSTDMWKPIREERRGEHSSLFQASVTKCCISECKDKGSLRQGKMVKELCAVALSHWWRM